MGNVIVVIGGTQPGRPRRHPGRGRHRRRIPDGAGGAFITGSDILMDGGVTAAYRFGELAPNQ